MPHDNQIIVLMKNPMQQNEFSISILNHWNFYFFEESIYNFIGVLLGGRSSNCHISFLRKDAYSSLNATFQLSTFNKSNSNCFWFIYFYVKKIGKIDRIHFYASDLVSQFELKVKLDLLVFNENQA
jgi:hypothetical protein